MWKRVYTGHRWEGLFVRAELAKDGQQPQQVVQLGVQVTRNDQGARGSLAQLSESSSMWSLSTSKSRQRKAARNRNARLSVCLIDSLGD